MEPSERASESGAAPRARKRAGIGWAAIVGGIAAALVVALVIWLLV
jgi:hypothetical protein